MPKCPHCGSDYVAKIFYGLPCMNETLEQYLNEGKVVLGGCTVTDFDPKYHCNSCMKKFGALANAFIEEISSLSFSVGGFFEGSNRIEFSSAPDGAQYEIVPSVFIVDKLCPEDLRGSIPLEEWGKLKETLYGSLFLNDWNKSYDNDNILDGVGWSLNIQLHKNHGRNYHGANAFPAYWRELLDLFRPYFIAAGVPFLH